MTMGQGLCIVMESTHNYLWQNRGGKKTQVFLLWVSFLASPFFHAYWYMWTNLCKWTRIKSPAVSGSYMLATPLKKCIIIGFEVGLIKLVISPCYFLWNTFLFIFFLFNSTWLTLVPCHPILSAFSPFYSVKCCFFLQFIL